MRVFFFIKVNSNVCSVGIAVFPLHQHKLHEYYCQENATPSPFFAESSSDLFLLKRLYNLDLPLCKEK